MYNEYRNIYQIARDSVGITQEKASELLDISIESLRCYEYDKRLPPDKVVIKMIEIYDSRYLAYQHLKHSAGVAATILPKLEYKDLPVAILSLQQKLKNIEDIKADLLDIGADGVISNNERKRWDEILIQLDYIASCILSLKFIK